MESFDWNPGTLLEMSGYYWKTCTLHASVKLDIFTVIGSKALSCDQINKTLKLDKRGLCLLLNSLSALGLLVKKEETYSNSPPALTFLSKNSPQYLGFMILHHHHLMESWHKMDTAIIEGKQTRRRSSFSDEERRESFLMGMFNIGMATAPGLSKELNLSGCKRLLDLGGGPGTFAIHFCLANPGLKASVYDLETTRPFAEKTIKKFNVSDRIDFLPGNYVEDEFIESNVFDAAWLSHILHGEGPEQAGQIIGKTVSALKPGSKIFIHEFILNDTMDGPLFPALFSINMYLGTPDGQSYSETQLSDMLKAHGVKNIKRLSFVGPTQSGILCGITS
ncbi:MAG: SAM-dependent methyltransferase [Deltaproteobacteria bacterium]|uniref:methyltransferase n=1 Tax=Desulfobacula sp. TaxID=2593537 RepID=UPI0019ABF095|nr:SAM-dependent methyltransferase [Candidatus Desulfobacula maris]MBL6996286.1 SAM-dependent methyltransferase [Desulfobacula sp.]